MCAACRTLVPSSLLTALATCCQRYKMCISSWPLSLSLWLGLKSSQLHPKAAVHWCVKGRGTLDPCPARQTLAGVLGSWCLGVCDYAASRPASIPSPCSWVSSLGLRLKGGLLSLSLPFGSTTSILPGVPGLRGKVLAAGGLRGWLL